MSKQYENVLIDTLSEGSCDEPDNRECDPTPVHLLHFKDPENCPLYDQIKLGRKMVEGRKNSKKYQTIKKGDILLLSDRKKGILECKVLYVKKYKDVKDYLENETIEKAFGDLSECRNIATIDDGIKVYEKFVHRKEIDKLREKYNYGFLGITIEFVHEYKRHYEDLQEPWFSHMKSGNKTVEGRLNKSWVATLNPLDMIEFTRIPPKYDLEEAKYKDPDEDIKKTMEDVPVIPEAYTDVGYQVAEDPGEASLKVTMKTYEFDETYERPVIVKTKVRNEKTQKISVLVTDVLRELDGKKISFARLFDHAGLNNVLPDIETYEDGIKVYRQFYSVEKEEEYGVVGIYFKLIEYID